MLYKYILTLPINGQRRASMMDSNQIAWTNMKTIMRRTIFYSNSIHHQHHHMTHLAPILMSNASSATSVLNSWSTLKATYIHHMYTPTHHRNHHLDYLMSPLNRNLSCSVDDTSLNCSNLAAMDAIRLYSKRNAQKLKVRSEQQLLTQPGCIEKHVNTNNNNESCS